MEREGGCPDSYQDRAKTGSQTGWSEVPVMVATAAGGEEAHRLDFQKQRFFHLDKDSRCVSVAAQPRDTRPTAPHVP